MDDRTSALTKLRILLVEDDDEVRLVLIETLESLGHSVCATATSENEAVAAAATTRPDLMIVDIGLSHGCGVSAVERILRTGRVAHFFITGERPEYRANGVPVLRKPFREAELTRSIDAALRLA